MWLMLQQETPDDYVVATNKLYSVRDFCEKTFSQLGLNYEDHVEMMVKKDLGIAQQELVMKETQLRSTQAA